MITLLFVLFLPFSLAVVNAQEPTTSWKMEEMNPMKSGEDNHDKKIEDISCGTDCKFALDYFRGKNVSGGKNILYISGGPGHIVRRENRDLEFLEDKYNVFYFDIRGAGFSFIEKPKSFDTALRAKHVVEDIERIRIKELGATGKWDAIYGHSHGTIVAQLYANSSQGGDSRVEKLILSAPLSRFKEFEFDRNEMLQKNLKSIFENYRRQNDNQKCPPGQPPPPDADPKGTDNFCFLTVGNGGRIETLINKLKGVLSDLTEKFGSINFVTEYYDELEEKEPDKLKHPYPKEFYLALRTLQFFGGSEPSPLIASEQVREAKVNAAFLLGYYLELNEERDFKPDAVFNPKNGCQPAAPFLDGITNEAWKLTFCDRYLRALASIVAVEKAELQSKRANIVYSLNDGLNRYIFRILEITDSCVDPRVVKDFGNATQANTHKVARALVRRIGIDLDEPICLWNPGGKNAHSTPTLILKGAADPFIAGCQAEEVFGNGLTGARVLFEFPGVGHLMRLPTFVANDSKTHGDEALAKLVDTFLKKSFEEFRMDNEVNELRKNFHAAVHTATGQGGASICPN
jgi:pimeloyl-ACP methyl ester carboxylesterase